MFDLRHFGRIWLPRHSRDSRLDDSLHFHSKRRKEGGGIHTTKSQAGLAERTKFYTGTYSDTYLSHRHDLFRFHVIICSADVSLDMANGAKRKAALKVS